MLLALLTIQKTSILHLTNSAALCYTEWTTEGCVTAEVDGNVVTCNCKLALLVNSSEFIFIGHINKLVLHFPSISFITCSHIFYLTMPAAPGCDAETTEFLSWPDTPAGTTQSHHCPNTITTISRTCSSYGVWESLDSSLCTPFNSINVVSVNVDNN